MQKLNTKKSSFLLLAAVAILALWSNKASAQTATSTLNVVLTAVQTIVVNSANNIINLNYNSASAYQNGVSSGPLTDHLQIFSTGVFTVQVKSSGDLVNVGPPSSSIPINTITLVAALGSSSPTITPTLTNVVLTNLNQPLIHNTNGALSAKFTVNYQSSGGSSYINLPAGTYTATITYTISPS